MLGKSLGDAGPYVAAAVVIAAVAAGFIALGVAAAGATLSILKFAIGNADAARTAELLAEQAKGGAAGLAATAKLALSLDSQSKKLKDDIGKIFSVGKPQLERFLEGLSKLGALFDSDSATGNAMKVVFSSIFDPLLDGITNLIPKLVSFFIQFEIMALKALIAIKPYGSTIEKVGEAFLVVVGILALMAAGFVAAVIAPFALIAVAATAVVYGIMQVGASLLSALDTAMSFGAGLMSSVGAALDYLSGLSLSEIGTQLIQGLIDGITSAGPKVLSSITSIATGAIDAAKKALGIASPSKVFAEIGGYTAEGMQQGVDDGANDVQSSMQSMVDPSAAASSGGAAAGGKSGSSASTSFDGAVFNFYSVTGDAKDFASQFREALQNMGAQLGTTTPATT